MINDIHENSEEEVRYGSSEKADINYFFGQCETAFYESVSSGNLEVVKNMFIPLGQEGFGTLSKDSIQDMKFHLVVSVAIIVQFCISRGLAPEEAYAVSSEYIRQGDLCSSEDELEGIYYSAVIEFTKKMRFISNGRIYSKNVTNALDYISDHLYDKLLVKDIADFLSCTVPYISRLFHEEAGVPLGNYISEKKIEAAENMLKYSNYSASEISKYLKFSSQSYFIKLFRKYKGMTPKEYRTMYYSTS